MSTDDTVKGSTGLFDHIFNDLDPGGLFQLSNLPQTPSTFTVAPEGSESTTSPLPQSQPQQQTDQLQLFAVTPLTIRYVTYAFNTRMNFDLSLLAVIFRNVLWDHRSPDRLNLKLRIASGLVVSLFFRPAGAIIIQGRLSKPEAVRVSQKVVKALRTRTPYQQSRLQDFVVANLLCTGNLGFEINLADFASSEHPHAIYDAQIASALLWSDDNKNEGPTSEANTESCWKHITD